MDAQRVCSSASPKWRTETLSFYRINIFMN